MQRRKQLRQERRNRLIQTSWRSVVVFGMAIGSVWVLAQPNWVIWRSEQVKIEGNRFLATQTIRSILPIQYPQSLMKIQASEISQTLTTKAPIASVTVERHLFPPELMIKVREREPVAQVFLGNPAAPPKPSKPDEKKESTPAAKEPGSKEKAEEKKPMNGFGMADRERPYGFLDENGMLLPLENYANLSQDLKMPDLKLIGNPETFGTHWKSIYPVLRRSPVKISAIDWQTPNNIQLNTELGIIHLGALSGRFSSQILTLDKMRQLPNRIPKSQIEYLDLRNPNQAMIQLKTGRASSVPAED